MSFDRSQVSFPYSFKSRFEDSDGANPEDANGAHMQDVFSMAFSNMLTEKGIRQKEISNNCGCEDESTGQGFRITSSHLTTWADIEGIDEGNVSKDRERCQGRMSGVTGIGVFGDYFAGHAEKAVKERNLLQRAKINRHCRKHADCFCFLRNDDSLFFVISAERTFMPVVSYRCFAAANHGDRHTVRRTTDVVEADAVKKFDRTGFYRHVLRRCRPLSGFCGASFFNTHFYNVGNTILSRTWKGSCFRMPLFSSPEGTFLRHRGNIPASFASGRSFRTRRISFGRDLIGS
jgi:hypothetical protein